MRFCPCVLALFLAACSSSHAGDDLGPDATGADLGGIDAPAPLDMSHGFDAGPPPPPGPVVCGTTTCADGELCCFTTLTCFDPALPSVCTVPMVDAGVPDGGDAGPPPCASNADCAPTELCDVDTGGAISGRCGGAGNCLPRRTPDLCGGFGDGVCGCDGRTYATPCQASALGVRVATLTPCGARVFPAPGGTFGCDAAHGTCMPGWHCDIAMSQCLPDHAIYACGPGGDCPPSTTCCATLGLCLDSTRADLCRIPPDGTVLPCATTDDCAIVSFDIGSSNYYCDGPGCTDPGGCRMLGGSCGGELIPVCGCDGTSYTNTCWAAEAGQRIAHDGNCP